MRDPKMPRALLGWSIASVLIAACFLLTQNSGQSAKVVMSFSELTSQKTEGVVDPGRITREAISIAEREAIQDLLKNQEIVTLIENVLITSSSQGYPASSELSAYLRTVIDVHQQWQSESVTLSVTAQDPALSQAIATALASSTYERTRAWYLEIAQSKKLQLNRQLDSYHAKIAELEKDDGRETSIEREAARTVAATRSAKLREMLEAAVEDRGTAHRQFLEAQSHASLVDSSKLGAVRSNLSDLEAELVQARLEYGPKHPYMIELIGSIEKLKAKLKSGEADRTISLQKRYEQAQVHEEKLRDQLADAVRREEALVSTVEGVTAEERELRTLSALVGSLQEEKISLERIVTRLTVTDSAPQFEVSMVSKSWSLIVLLFGALFGLFVALARNLYREFSRDSIESSHDVTSFLKVQVRGMIPEILSTNENPRLLGAPHRLLGWDKTAESESSSSLEIPPPSLVRAEGGWLIAFDALEKEKENSEQYRDAIDDVIFSLIETRRARNERVLMISGAEAGAGATTLACSIGVRLAEQGFKTLIVDADTIAPSIEGYFDSVPGTSDLVDYSEKSLALRDVVCDSNIHNLSIATFSRRGRLPLGLYDSPVLGRFFDEGRAGFDFVLVDTPAVLRFKEGLLFAEKVDAVSLVVDARASGRSSAQSAISQFQRFESKSIEVLVNRVAPQKICTEQDSASWQFVKGDTQAS